MKKREYHGGQGTALYGVWKTMIQRCTNPGNAKWPSYGARGITVCGRWRNSFATFRSDMGERPKGTSLDRIDNSKGYEPSNCRWATPSAQTINSRIRRDNATGVKGVSYLKRKAVWKYCVHISAEGKRRHLGYTTDFFEACCMRKSAENIYQSL